MGETLDAMRTGTVAIQWVAAIEGFPYLITDATAAQAVAAWAGSDYAAAVSGLVVYGDWSQKLDPWDAFPAGGTLKLSVQPDDDDRLAAMFKNSPRPEDTFLNKDISADESSIEVDDATTLTSPVYIGTERIQFTGSTPTELTGCTRGRRSPFSTHLNDNRFGRAHRATTDEATTQLRPVVGDAPRVWIGKHVGLWAHRVVGGVLDVHTEAQLVFAGRIANITDDPTTGCTVIDVEDMAEAIGETVIGRDSWSANVAEGILVVENDRMAWRDYDGVITRYADHLVGTVGASTPNEIEPGRYTATQLCSAINAWLASEKLAGRIAFNVSFRSPILTEAGYRTVVTVNVPNMALNTNTYLKWSAPYRLAIALGFDEDMDHGGIAPFGFDGGGATTGIAFIRTSPRAPIKYALTQDSLDVADEVGTVSDQLAHLPPHISGWTGSGTWGVFRCGDYVFAAEYSTGALTNILALPEFNGGQSGLGIGAADEYAMAAGGVVDHDAGDRLTVRQIFVIYFEEWADGIVKLFASTGAAGYNHPTYDTLPTAVGAGIPWSLLSDDFVDSVGQLDGPGVPTTLVIDKPTTLKALINDDLLIRRAGLVFKNGTYRFARWATPNAVSTVDHSFSDANKAAPRGTVDPGRSATRIDSSAQRGTVKLRFNRLSINEDDYRDRIVLQDRVAIDDAGGSLGVATISLRNTFHRIGGADDDALDALATSYLATMPLFSRPARLLTRSVSPQFFAGVAPGDTCEITELFARNPDTGMRGLSAYRGIIVAHKYDWGGPEAGKPGTVRPMGGQVTIMLADDDRTRPYCPAAQVDDTVTGGGFSAGYNSATSTLRCYPHAHSENAAFLDPKDASRFAAADVVRVIEIDPTTAGAEISWIRTVSVVSGDDITFTAGLSAPAWDAAKKYRVIPADYASAGRFQAHAYEADSADALIIDTVRAHHYASSAQAGRTMPSDSNLPERHAGNDIGDGKPYHVAQDRAVARGINNLRRSKTRRQAPTFLDAFHQVDEATNWDLLAVQIVNLRHTSSSRLLEMTARWRSATGAAAQLRITVTPNLPSSPNPADADDSINFIAPFRRSTAFSTSSTTYRTDNFSVDASIADANGLAIIVVEGQGAAQFSGFQKLAESVSGAQIRENWWCRNGHAPQADFVALATRRLRATYNQDTKLVFSHGGTFAWPTSSAGTRHRWRFACRTGVRARRLAIAWLIAPATIVTTESYCTFQLTDVAAATATSVVVHVGAVEIPKSTLVPLSDCWFGISYIDCDPSKDYEVRITDFGGARVASMAVWEVPSTTPLATPFVSATAPILDSQRQFLLGAITDALEDNGAHLFNWTVDIGGSGHTTTSTTARNLFDNSSTAVSATTPGVVPQISNCRTLARAGVPVVFKVYGAKTGAGNCEVTLKDDTGAILATCTINSVTDAWYTATVLLPASDAEKYDVHYRVTAGATTGEVKHVSCYQAG